MVKAAIILILLAAPGFLAAHHSASRYDMSREVDIEGTVSRVEWSNPHVYLYVQQESRNGELIEWEVEQHPPAMLRRMGWQPDTLRPGDRILVSGNPTRVEQSRGIYPANIKKDGLDLYQSGDFVRLSEPTVVAAQGAGSIAGVWETMVSLPLILSFYNPDHELTEAGKLAMESYDEATMLPGLQCIPYSSPVLMFDPDFKRIDISEGVIEITGGYAGAVRRIYLNEATHEGATPSLQGHSIGHWQDARTLVIDTTRFSEHRAGNGYRGLPSGLNKQLLETIQLSDDGKSLQYSFELSDPEYLAAPVTGTVQWAYRPDVEYSYEPCSLENAGRYLE